MAYFANSCEGEILDDQCGQCLYSEEPCPIIFVQMEYNYEQCANEKIRELLNFLVNKKGECEMFKVIKNTGGLMEQNKELLKQNEELKEKADFTREVNVLLQREIKNTNHVVKELLKQNEELKSEQSQLLKTIDMLIEERDEAYKENEKLKYQMIV